MTRYTDTKQLDVTTNRVYGDGLTQVSLRTSVANGMHEINHIQESLVTLSGNR